MNNLSYPARFVTFLCLTLCTTSNLSLTAMDYNEIPPMHPNAMPMDNNRSSMHNDNNRSSMHNDDYNDNMQFGSYGDNGYHPPYPSAVQYAYKTMQQAEAYFEETFGLNNKVDNNDNDNDKDDEPISQPEPKNKWTQLRAKYVDEEINESSLLAFEAMFKKIQTELHSNSSRYVFLGLLSNDLAKKSTAYYKANKHWKDWMPFLKPNKPIKAGIRQLKEKIQKERKKAEAFHEKRKSLEPIFEEMERTLRTIPDPFQETYIKNTFSEAFRSRPLPWSTYMNFRTIGAFLLLCAYILAQIITSAPPLKKSTKRKKMRLDLDDEEEAAFPL